ncbi:MAG: M15 family metallopeptidase [Clostridia bacterium]|nr:M15 family metallopeptidase [Clostridia bacterium]
MIPIKRLMLTTLVVLLFLSPCALAETPVWDYPLDPEIIQNAAGYITLANRNVLLESGYVPNDLVTASVQRARGTGKMQLRQAASEGLTAMFAAAKEAGYTLYLKSAYRAYSTQKTMYYNRLEKNHGRDDGLVSYPGASDHQTGLGCDILNYDWTLKDGMNKNFAATHEAQWMEAHCQEFGFILRYMSDKEEITMIKFEPWHFRYVGVEAATYIMENHLSLEEFTEEWQAYLASYEASGGDFAALIKERARLNDPTVVDYADDGEEELSIFY